MKLYKYMKSANYTIETISKSILKVDALSSYNDSYEFIPVHRNSNFIDVMAVLGFCRNMAKSLDTALSLTNESLLLSLYYFSSDHDFNKFLDGDSLSFIVPKDFTLGQFVHLRSARFDIIKINNPEIRSAIIKISNDMEDLLYFDERVEVTEVLKEFMTKLEENPPDINTYVKTLRSINKPESPTAFIATARTLNSGLLNSIKNGDKPSIKDLFGLCLQLSIMGMQHNFYTPEELNQKFTSANANSLFATSFGLFHAHYEIIDIGSSDTYRTFNRHISSKNLKSLCLTRNRNDDDMWQRYGGDSSGVMLEFEAETIFNDAAVAANVHYVNNLSSLDLDNIDFDILHNNVVIDNHIKRFLVKTKFGFNIWTGKSVDWSREMETRFLFADNSASITFYRKLQMVRFENKSLLSITIGSKASKAFVKEVTIAAKLCFKTNNKLKLYYNGYSIDISGERIDSAEPH